MRRTDLETRLGRRAAITLMAGGLSALVISHADTSWSVEIMRSSRMFEWGSQSPADKIPVCSCAALDLNHNLMATGGDDHLVRLWNSHSGQQVNQLKGHSQWVRAVAFRPDGKVLASGGDDRRLILWDMATSSIARELPEQTQSIQALSFSLDARCLACGLFDGTVRVYEKEKLWRDLASGGTAVTAVAFSPDGQYLAVGQRSGPVRLWSMRTGRVVHELPESRWVRAVAFSADGTVLATGGVARTIRLWDSKSGELLHELPERPGTVLSLAFCGPSLLASGGTDNTIRLWDLANRQDPERTRLVGHTGSVSTLAWDPKNGMLFSSGFDTTVRVWNVEASATERLSRRERTDTTTP